MTDTPTRKPEWDLKVSVQLVNTPGRRPYYRATRTVAWDRTSKRAIQVSGYGPDERSARERMMKNIELRQAGTTQTDFHIPRKVRELTLEAWLREWQSRLTCSDNTLTHIESRMRLHVYQSELGQMKLRAIRNDDCQKFLTQLTQKVNPKTGNQLLGDAIRRKIYYDLFGAFEEAVHSDRIQLPRNPMASSEVKPPKVNNKPKDSERLAEIAVDYRSRIWTAVGKEDRDKARWAVALLGLRQGEALGLTVDSVVETPRGTKLKITHALKRRENRHGCGEPIGNSFPCGKKRSTGCPQVIPGAYYLGSPKTPTSARTIPLTGDYETFLLERKKRVMEILKNPPSSWKPDKGLERLLFQREDGRPRGSHEDADAWHAFLKKNNIEDFRGHGTRHITVSILAGLGFDAATIQQITGWSNATMMAVYNHQVWDKLVGPIDQLGKRMAEHDFNHPSIPSTDDEEEWSE